MNINLRKGLTTLVFTLFLIPAVCSAQNVTGIWRGYFITGDGARYKLEVQLEQAKSNSLSGVTYSYLSTIFYGKAQATGFIKNKEKSVLIREIRTVELKMAGGSVACIMKYNLSYSKSGKDEFLKGPYSSIYEKSTMGFRKGDDCGGGQVFLTRVQTSDFYIEPFLRDDPARKKPSDVPKTAAPVKKTVVTPKPATPKTEKVLPKPKINPTLPADTQQKRNVNPVVVDGPKKEIPKLVIPPSTRSRTNELTQTLTVRNEEVIVKLYDNGTIDDDTISVYLDGQILLSNKRLSATPLKMTLKINEESPEHVLVMVAENLGRIPPNTSLMIVEDGDKQYQVRITSTTQKNAMVRFRFQR
jgi:hypothetical protein